MTRRDFEETRTDPTQSLPAQPDGASDPPLRLPSRYELGRRLGKGGFGSVFAARDRLLGRDVAVKVIAAHGARASLERETSALRLLDLPGVVRLLDSGSSEGTPWFVMERIEGKPFPHGSEPVRWESLRMTVLELLRALARIHRAGFVHGDLKPSNVIVRSDGAPVILDLGLAHSPVDSAHPSLGGTPLYMAPEQLSGLGAVPASDLYAVGLMLWRALTGRWPHGDLPIEAAVIARLRPGAPQIGESGLPVPPFVGALIATMLEREPGRRPASALACVERLAPDELHIALESDPTSAEDLSRVFLGWERLLHVPSTAASILWNRCEGDPSRMRRTLSAWILLGVATRTDHGVSIPLDTLERLLAGWAPENDVREPGNGVIPRSPLAVCLSLSSSQDRSVAASALALVSQERARGNLRGAGVCLLEGLRACWRTQDFAHERALISAAADLALADRSLGAIDEAIDIIGRARVASDRELELLRAARALQDGRRDVAIAILEPDRPSDSLDLQRARHDLRVQVVVNGPLEPDRLAALDRELALWVATSGADEQRHLHRWRARLLYRQERMQEAGQEAELAVAIEPAAFDRLNSLFAAAAAWIEAADVDRTMAIAESAKALAAELRLPRLEARAEWLLRAVLNRSGMAMDPDLELVEASRELGSPHIEGLIAVTEAAICWRSGHSSARWLAAQARSAFVSAGYAEAASFARALEIACGGGDSAEAEALASQVCAARRPDVAVEVLGLLATSGKLQGTWRDAFEEQARALVNRDPDWRSGALSVNEARTAVESLEGFDTEPSH